MRFLLLVLMLAAGAHAEDRRSWNFKALPDNYEKAERLSKEIQHDCAGVFWQTFYTSESDESVSLVLLKEAPKGESYELKSALDCLQCVADSDDEANLRVKLLTTTLAKVRNLRAYKIDDGKIRPTYIIGGDIGTTFVGIKAKATET